MTEHGVIITIELTFIAILVLLNFWPKRAAKRHRKPCKP
jgi:hypothetical protein